ncbi:T9SS type B sorting domain-containing protein [Flavobacterium sp. BFFFF1]|uniref:T9SS type B sorting domain-containing protein n=1 Tax=Flavobacterium sp. BFFFF1 TaxID=2015557 RepID=UPI0025C40AFB|nr:T9SS type B sorting domain-containing protein [Flavobacterium sp. BFFFF1]
MKNKILLLLTFLGFIQLNYSQLASPSVSGVNGNNAGFCNGTSTASIQFTPGNSTTAYSVAEIPYNPPYSFDPIPGSTLIPIPTNGNQDDFWAPQLFTLPFSFSFYGNNYNTMSIGSNGVLCFNTTGAYAPNQVCPWPIAPGGLPNCTTIRNAIFGILQDINFTDLPYPETTINYYVYDQGANAAPGRVFIFNVNKVLQFGDGIDPDTNVAGVQTYQMVLYETTNIIDVYVKRRVPFNGWNGGRGVIGLINNAGTQSISAPGCNGTAFTAIGKAYRFTPAGPPTATVNWLLNGSPVASGNTTVIDIPNTSPGDIITAEVTYNNGNVQSVFSTDLTVSDLPLLPDAENKNKVVCPGNDGPYEFNINQDDVFLAGVTNPLNYEIYYYLDPQSAQDEGLNYIQNTTAYQVNASDLPLTIYAVIKDISGTDCKVFKNFTLNKTLPGGTISYGTLPICKDSAGSFDVMTTDLTPGGEYVASSPDLVINSVTGTVDLIQSIAGSYVVDYFPTTECPDFKISAPITIVATPTAAFVTGSQIICPSTSTAVTFSGTPDAIIYYSKTNATDGTVNENTTVGSDGFATINPTINEETVFELQKVGTNTTPSCEYIFPAGTTITFSFDPPTAIIIGADDTDFCPGGSTNINVSGTAGGVINYTGGPSGGGSVQLDATSGFGFFDTQGLGTTTIFTLTDISVPGCAQSAPITGQSITIVVNPLPVVTSFTATTATVCEGTDALFDIAGTANATVNYHDSNNATFSYIIPTSGNGQIQRPAGTYTLDNVTSTDGCVSPLTLSATVGADLKPVITAEPTAPAAICEQESFTISVQATGTDLTYEFKHGATTVQNTTSNTYTKTNASLADAGAYQVIVHGKCVPDAISATVQAVVNEGPHFVTGPAALPYYCETDDVTLNVTTTGTDGSTNYTWRKNGQPFGAPSSSTLEIFGVTSADNGTIYDVLVTNPGCPAITSTATTVNVFAPVVITSQPVPPVPVCSGGGFSLSVAATGQALSYEWRRGTQVVQSGPSNMYVVNNADPDVDAGDYQVTVSGTCGAPQVSTVATVTIDESPQILTQPVAPPTDLCLGFPLTLSVVASGDITQYQWKRDGVVVGTNSPTYSVSSVSGIDKGIYVCVISNPTCPPITTDPVEVVIKDAAVITQQPVSQTVCVGEPINLIVAVTGDVTYRWQHDGVDVGTDALYHVDIAQLSDSGVYRCVISNFPCPDIYTNAVNVIVRPLPDATIANGADTTICADTATDVIITGTPNAIVTYTVNGGNEETITLNPSGSARLLTGPLSGTTSYELVSVSANDNPPCPKDLTGAPNSVAVVTVTVVPDPELDQDGYICLDAATGTTAAGSFYELNTGLTTADGYSFVWSLDGDEIVGASEGSLNATEPGMYKVVVTDVVAGCTQSATAPIVTSTPPLTITAQVDTEFFADNATIEVTATPAGQYEYRLDDGPWQTDNIFNGVRTIISLTNSGDHTVYVRDLKACDELSYDVKVIDYPKYFTPNGDGIHDTWNISVLSNQPNAKIYIFDRFGKLLKQISTTNPGGWDGTYNGQQMMADDYWFVVKYVEQGVNKEFRANFALKR